MNLFSRLVSACFHESDIERRVLYFGKFHSSIFFRGANLKSYVETVDFWLRSDHVELYFLENGAGRVVLLVLKSLLSVSRLVLRSGVLHVLNFDSWRS